MRGVFQVHTCPVLRMVVWVLSCRRDGQWLNASAAVLKKLGCLRVLPLGDNFQLTHQHIPDGFDGEKRSPSCFASGSFHWKCRAYQVFFFLQSKQPNRPSGSPQSWTLPLIGKQGQFSSESHGEETVFTTTKGRIYDSVLCTFMYFMGTQNEVFTNESI